MGTGLVNRFETIRRAPFQSVRSESSGVGVSSPTRSGWMDRKPKARILADAAESEPTKPPKPGCVGFDGATSAESPEIEAWLDQAELAPSRRARQLRFVVLVGCVLIGCRAMWTDRNFGPRFATSNRTSYPRGGRCSNRTMWAKWKAPGPNQLFPRRPRRRWASVRAAIATLDHSQENAINCKKGPS